MSIEQVALHAGYQSRSSFTRLRKHYGTAPSNYRSEANRVSRCVSDRRGRRPE
ncbi:AraC family transcriptional regulator [Bradyrhizobium sp. URHC0002]